MLASRPVWCSGRMEEAKNDGSITQWLHHPSRESVEILRIYMRGRGLCWVVLVCHWTGLQDDFDSGLLREGFHFHESRLNIYSSHDGGAGSHGLEVLSVDGVDSMIDGIYEHESSGVRSVDSD